MIVIMMCISAILSDYKDATDKVNNGLKKTIIALILQRVFNEK